MPFVLASFVKHSLKYSLKEMIKNTKSGFSFLREKISSLFALQVSRDSLKTLFLKIAGTGLSFISAVFLSRSLGAEGYGIYSYILVVITILSMPALAGLPQLIIRETSRSIVKEEFQKVKGLWQWAFRIVVKNTVFALVVAVIVMLLGISRAREHAGTILWALLLIPLNALGNLRSAGLTGLQRVWQGQMPEFLVRPVIFLILLFMILQITDITPGSAMAINAFSAFIAFISGAWLLWRHTPLAVKKAKPLYEARQWRTDLWPFTFLAVINVINSTTDILIAGLFLPSDKIGVYRIAAQIAIFSSFGLQAINTVIGPRLARLYAIGDMEKLQRLVTMSARAVLLFNLIVAIFFFLAGRGLITLIFGSSFAPAYEPLLILLLGQFINSAAGSVGLILNMTGHEKITAKGMAIALITNVVLNFTLIPFLGIHGAATASAISMALWNAILWWIVLKKTGINSLAFGRGV